MAKDYTMARIYCTAHKFRPGLWCYEVWAEKNGLTAKIKPGSYDFTTRRAALAAGAESVDYWINAEKQAIKRLQEQDNAH